MITTQTLNKLSAMMKQAQINCADNSDEQALTTKELYPLWEDIAIGTKLTVGTRLNYNEELYKVITEHQKQEDWNPEIAPSLFAKVLIEDPYTIPEWEQPNSTNGYATGDKVTHNGVTWESHVDNNVWEPGAPGTESLWVEVEV